MELTILNRIQSPKDLKNLTAQERVQLAIEVRQTLLNAISQTGGHLGSNLGVVELTIALHTAFDSPEDRLVFDVGHQSYVHKMFTGRLDRIHTIRQYNGLCGFTKPDESEHDAIIAGHAGTSISNAVGMAIANKIKGNKNKVVSISGDAAFTSGMAYEALNNAGELGVDLIVVLNANNMSISPNVGAIHRYFTKILTWPIYNSLKNKVEDLIDRIPKIGHSLVKTSHKIEEGIKGIFVPATIFEEMGFKYLGPIDGHDTEFLIETFKALKDMKGPILLHVVTQKGKGYEPAEKHPENSHGVTPFDVSTGQPKDVRKMETYSSAFGKILTQIADEDQNVVAITAAMKSGTGLTPFASKHPNRFFDVGIAEQHAVTFAAGLARNGLKPVVAIYSTFLQRAYDQVIHDVAIAGVPVKFVLDRCGLVGDDGPTHHGVFDMAYLRCIPKMAIIQPRDYAHFEMMMRFAVNYQNGPIAVRIPRGAVPEKIGELEPFELGKAQVLYSGKDLSIVTYGDMLSLAFEVRDTLKSLDVDVEVVDIRSIKPLDEKLLNRIAQSHGRIVTIENHVLRGGFGSSIVEFYQQAGLSCRVLSFGIPDEFIEHGKVDKLFEYCGLNASHIVKQVQREFSFSPILTL